MVRMMLSASACQVCSMRGPDNVVAGVFEDEGADGHFLAPFSADEQEE